MILGIKEYTSIDINGEYNSIPYDLNEPFNDKSKFNKYDIVTDYGLVNMYSMLRKQKLS